MRVLIGLREFFDDHSPEIKHLLVWVVFVAGFASLPLLLLALSGSVIRGQEPTQEKLFGGGEVLLICCAVAADAMGRIVSAVMAKRAELDLGQLVGLISALWLIVAPAAEYASILPLKGTASVNTAVLVLHSKAFALATILVGLGTILSISEDARED